MMDLKIVRVHCKSNPTYPVEMLVNNKIAFFPLEPMFRSLELCTSSVLKAQSNLDPYSTGLH